MMISVLGQGSERRGEAGDAIGSDCIANSDQFECK